MQSQAAVGNSRFFARTGPHTLSAVAAAANCTLPRSDTLIAGLAALTLAEPDELSFAAGNKHAAALAKTRAAAVLVRPDMLPGVPPGTIPLLTPDPVQSWGRIVALFHPVPDAKPGIHPMAVIQDGARIHPTAEIGPLVVIEAGAEIGPGCKIAAGAFLGAGVVLGRNCRIGPHASISHAVLGDRVYVYPGARIGQEGFGFTITPAGFQSSPQLGHVIIGDDVEVGANTTIDRGALRNTMIGAGTRIDNQVQIAHGVRIGRHCAIAGMVGMCGSVQIDDFVVVGGQACFVEHVHVGSHAQVSAQSLVTSNVEAGARVFGSPARKVRDAFREVATLRKLARAGRSREGKEDVLF